MSGGGGGFGQALVNSGMRMGGQAPAQKGAGYSAPPPSTPYQSAFNSQQTAAPAQMGSIAGEGMGGGLGGGLGGGIMSFADYNPSAAPGGSGLFSGGQPGPGQVNFQVSEAQKANLLAQQQMQDQMLRQQAPQQMQQRFMSPLRQQQMMRQQPMFNPMQQQSSGLQAAMMQMMGRQNQPMQRQQFMPQYQNRALQYRPNMAQAQESLSRVKPSVQKQEQDAQAARIAELEAQLAGFSRPSNDYGGGG